MGYYQNHTNEQIQATEIYYVAATWQ